MSPDQRPSVPRRGVTVGQVGCRIACCHRSPQFDRACIPFLQRAANPHILNLSPPLNMEARWFAPHLAYTMTKFGMSMCVLGMAEELRPHGIAVNALWPDSGLFREVSLLLANCGGRRRF